MSDTINIGGIQVSKFYLGGSSDVKIYLGTTKLYPHLQEPCFAVVDNVSTYTARTYVDVYETSSEKWYKLNNLNAYEEYGIYGSGRTITYYEGKLTIDGDYEYQYSGSSWVNVGEISGNTATLPDVSFMLNYNAKNYDSTTHSIAKTSGQAKDVDAVCNYGYHIVDHSTDGYITVTGNTRMLLSGTTYLGRNNTETGCTMTIVSKARTSSGYSILTNRGRAGYSEMNWMWRYPTDGIFLHGSSSYNNPQYFTNTSTSPIVASIRTYYDGGVKQTLNDWTNNGSYSGSFGYGDNYNGNSALFCDYAGSDLEFWRGDFYWVYMTQDVLTDEQIQQVIDYNESSGGTVEYPVYYDEMQDPPNYLSFSSMTEAEEYECPWVGMKATIAGSGYTFNSNYEWEYIPSRLPVGYTEVQYIENESVAYINTSFKPNQDTRVIARMQTVTSMMHARFFGAGAWNGSNGYQFDYENYYNGQLHISWGAINGWSTYNYYGDYSAHTYDWNKNVFTIDNGVFSAETTYTSFQCTDNLGLFVHIYNGSPCGDISPWTEGYERSFLHGRLYSCQIYDNGTLIRDLVPCTRDSDSKVGVYDIVNDVFYSSAYSGYEFTAGPAVN